MNRERTTAHVSHNSGDNEWYTPSEFIEAARTVLNEIELDPASSEEANKVVKAIRFFTPKDDGLKQKWSGKTWMNPPYAGELIGGFTEKLRNHFDTKDIPEAIALVNNATETKWFHNLCLSASAICFPLSRVKFWHPRKTATATPLQGQAVVYLGKNPKKFGKAFKIFGLLFYADI
jgi:ParB family chromosome partitioning protein